MYLLCTSSAERMNAGLSCLQACIVINNRRQRQRRGRLTDDEYRSGEIQIQFQIQRN